jgi:hypothetical protein
MVQPVHQAFAAEEIEDIDTEETTDVPVEQPVTQDDEVSDVPETTTETEMTLVDEEDLSSESISEPDTTTSTDELSDIDEEITTQTETDTDEAEVSTTSTAATEVASSTAGAPSTTTQSTADTDSNTTEPETDSSQSDNDSSTGGGSTQSDDNEDVEEETATSSTEIIDEDTTNNDEDMSPNNTESNNTDSETVSTSTPTTTATDNTNMVEVSYAVTEQNFYQFSKQSCVAVGDGTFHCSDRTETEVNYNTAVFADVGASGNMEIFMRTSRGDVEQLTDNNRDDTAPHLDPESMRIVWQRMVDGRYQVIVYDIASEEETQLTFTRNNNMEPKVSEDGIVWQAWDGNDWEIMYFDGVYTEQITENNTQDVTPAIQEGYIVWSVLGQDEQLARVYSLDSKETMSITGHEGGTVANPRFVLVYDTQFDNGDIVTQGFDPETGIASPLAAQPGQQPIDIPNTDTTGEKIALIQNKSSSKDEKDGLEIKTTAPSTATTSVATSTAELNLNEAATSSDIFVDEPDDLEETDVASSTVLGEFELTEYDLVILEEDNEIKSTSTPKEVTYIEKDQIKASSSAIQLEE